MKAKWTVFVIVILAAALTFSAALISAQEATDEATAEPSSFADNRINQDISTSMGGVGIYCVDQNGSTAGNTFQNGSIEVWGANGEKFIVLTVDQLRGNDEIVQPVVMPDASATMEATEEAAPLATAMPPATDEVTGAVLPVLLARASTPNGEIWMYRVGEDTFAIQGTDSTGKFYTYTWAGCSLGSIATDTAPIMSFEPGEVMPEATMEATAEATAAA